MSPQVSSFPGKEAAIVNFLEAVADGEICIEQLRVLLCEEATFEPHLAFRTLMTNGLFDRRKALKGYVTAEDLRYWLLERSNGAARTASDQEVLSLLLPYAASKASSDWMLPRGPSQLKYEGFLRLAMPRNHQATKQEALSRPVASATRGIGEVDCSAQVSQRLKRLFDEEIELLRRLRKYRMALEHHGCGTEEVLRFLRGDLGGSTAWGVSLVAIRSHLVEEMRVFTVTRAEALFHRLNTSGSGAVSHEEMAAVLQPDSLHREKVDRTIGAPIPLVHDKRADSLELSRRLQAVMDVMARQAYLDALVQAAKAQLNKRDLPSILSVVDKSDKGYVADTDIWLCLKEVARPVELSAVGAWMQRTKLASDSEKVVDENQSSLPSLSHKEFVEALGWTGVPVPTHKLSAASKTFEDHPLDVVRPLPSDAAVNHPLFRYLEVACQAADEDERMRIRLARTEAHDGDSSKLVADAFAEITNGNAEMQLPDLQRALRERCPGKCQELEEIGLLWNRYAGRSETLSLPDFAKKILPPPPRPGVRG